ncbi:MAG: hypothetical protein GY794_15995 [bacterium]|nr:hypothetical protein [bacterium]
MIKKLTIVALMLSLVPLIGCGPSDPHEKAVVDMMDCMEEMADVLATVTDEASAEEAKPKLEAVAERMQTLKKDMDKLGEPDKEKEEALKEKYEERMKEVTKKMMKENMRVMMNPKLNKILADSMKKM